MCNAFTTARQPKDLRMSVILTAREQTPYLDEGLSSFEPARDLLTTRRTANPLLKNPPSHIKEEFF